MNAIKNETTRECKSNAAIVAAPRTGRRAGSLFMAGFLACLGMACLPPGTAAAASKEVTILTKVVHSGKQGQEVVKAIRTGNIPALNAILAQGEWGIDDFIILQWKEVRVDTFLWGDYPGKPLGEPRVYYRSEYLNGQTTQPFRFSSHEVKCTWNEPLQEESGNDLGGGDDPREKNDGCYRVLDQKETSVTTDIYGTPLMYAARLGRVRIVKRLLELGANPNVMLRTGGVELSSGQGLAGVKRPFLCALTDAYMLGDAFNGKTAERADQIGQMLVEAGAELPPEDVWARNALWDAAIARSPRLFNLCIDNWLDPDGEDNVGHTVMNDIAATLRTMEEGDFRESLFGFKKALEKSGSVRQE